MPPLEQSFVPRERTALPRILLIDYTDNDAQSLIDAGYTIYRGFSGLSGTPYQLPCHESELEIIFWDTRNHLNDNRLLVGEAEHIINSPHGQEIMQKIDVVLSNYAERMCEKGGFFAVFMSNQQSAAVNHRLPDILNKDFSLFRRVTTTLNLISKRGEDVWCEFFKRHIQEEDIVYGIDWHGNFVGLGQYFTDEDGNWFAVKQGHTALIPVIRDNRMSDAVKFLLQEVLPRCCRGETVFPDKYFYHWANGEKYLPPSAVELIAENKRLVEETELQIEVNKTEILKEMDENDYLTSLLITDDSNLFPEGSRLSDHLQIIFESDLGFTVTDVDEMNLSVGKALKEDKWIEDGEYFALVEVKGTEKGAKASWVRTDLNAHIREFEVVKKTTGINSILIFNHDRRTAPEDRSVPFTGDDNLIEFCRDSNILLLPVYEIFKLVREIKKGTITAVDARDLIKGATGLFTYTNLGKDKPDEQ